MTIWKYCSFVTSYLKANFLMIYQEFYCCYCFKKHSFQEPSLLQYHCKLMVTHSSPLAWKIPWSEEPGGLQSMGSLRVGHDWATSLSLFTFMHWGRKWQPTPVFLPGESQGWESLVGCVYGVTQSRTRLKWLSSRGYSRVGVHGLLTVVVSLVLECGL